MSALVTHCSPARGASAVAAGWGAAAALLEVGEVRRLLAAAAAAHALLQAAITSQSAQVLGSTLKLQP